MLEKDINYFNLANNKEKTGFSIKSLMMKNIKDPIKVKSSSLEKQNFPKTARSLAQRTEYNINNFNNNPLEINSLYTKTSMKSQKSYQRKKFSIDFSSFTPKDLNNFSFKKPAFIFSKPEISLKQKVKEKDKNLENSSNFLKGFLNMEGKSQNIIDILNKKWDKTLEECLKIEYFEKYMDIMQERKTNSDKTSRECFEIFSILLKSHEEINLLDLLRLLFAEQSEIIKNYEDFIKRKLFFNGDLFDKNEESGKLRKNHEKDKNISNFEDLQEIIQLLSRMFFKKFTDLTVVLENKEEPYWSKRIRALKMKFRLDKNSADLIKNLDNLENLFLELMGKVTDLTIQKDQIINEHLALKKTLEKNYMFSKAETKEILMKPIQKETDVASKYSLDFLKKFENIYKKSSEELSKKNEDLMEELNKTKKTLDEKQEYINEMAKKRKNLKKNKEKTTEDKEIQINFLNNFENSQISPLLHPNHNPLKHYIHLTINAYQLSDSYIKSLINLILSDKIYDDFQDFLDKTPIKPLKSYVFEWFLTRFGNQTYAETLMSDFFACLLNFSSEIDRYSVFARLCGINLENYNKNVIKKKGENEEFVINFEEDREKPSNELLNSFYCSSQAVDIYLKLAYYVKHKIDRDNKDTKDKENKEKEIDQYSPLFPDFDEEVGLIHYEFADKIVKIIVEEELSDEHLVFEITNGFNYLVSSEKMPKLVKKNALGNLSPKRNSSVIIPGKRFGSIELVGSPINMNSSGNYSFKPKNNDFLIPFDILARFILDNMAKIFAQKIEVIVTSFKLQQSNRKINDFFIEDFMMIVGKQMNKSTKWLHGSFAEFIVNSKNHNISTVYQLIYNHLENLMKGETLDKFYIDSYHDKPKEKEKLKDDNAEFPVLLHSERSFKKKKIPTASSMKKNNNVFTFEEKNEKILPEDLKNTYEKNYDYVSSITVLIETYGLLKENIKREEVGNDILYMNHEIFRKEINRLPQGLASVKVNFWNKFVGYDRNELIARIEACWKTLRLIIDCVYSRGEKK